MRLMEFPEYGTLKDNIFEKMKWDGFTFRSYRVSITYSPGRRTGLVGVSPSES
jgi:hypothetical protein